MPFPIGPAAGSKEPESNFSIQDSLGLRCAVTPVFAIDLQDGTLRAPGHGGRHGLGTSFYVTPFGHQLSAMHVITDYLNEAEVIISPGSITDRIGQADTVIAILHDPGLCYGARPAGDILRAVNFAIFPVDQSKHPLAMTFTRSQLKNIEPSLDLASWRIHGLSDRKAVYLPLRVGCGASVKNGDRVMAVGYPKITSWRRPAAEMVTFQEEMRGSIGQVIEVKDKWDQENKIWPTLTVDVQWASGMSGGPVLNENGEVVGIVSRGADCHGDSPAWSSALWLEQLPFQSDIFGRIDPRFPGWVCGWGVCNPSSLIELFETREAAEAFAQRHGAGLTVAQVSTPYRTQFRNPSAPDDRRARPRS